MCLLKASAAESSHWTNEFLITDKDFRALPHRMAMPGFMLHVSILRQLSIAYAETGLPFLTAEPGCVLIRSLVNGPTGIFEKDQRNAGISEMDAERKPLLRISKKCGKNQYIFVKN